MKHNIRINGQVMQIDCQFGSGILDKNGREIFEGDKVNVDNWGVCEVYVDQWFWLLDGCDFNLDELATSALEIVD